MQVMMVDGIFCLIRYNHIPATNELRKNVRYPGLPFLAINEHQRRYSEQESIAITRSQDLGQFLPVQFEQNLTTTMMVELYTQSLFDSSTKCLIKYLSVRYPRILAFVMGRLKNGLSDKLRLE